MLQIKLPTTKAFVLLGLTKSVFDRSVRCSAFYPGLTFTIEPQNKISTLVLRSATVAGGEYILIVPFAIIYSPGLTFTIELLELSSSLVILLGCGSGLNVREGYRSNLITCNLFSYRPGWTESCSAFYS